MKIHFTVLNELGLIYLPEVKPFACTGWLQVTRFLLHPTNLSPCAQAQLTALLFLCLLRISTCLCISVCYTGSVEGPQQGEKTEISSAGQTITCDDILT